MSEIVGACLSQFHDDENSFEILLAFADGREIGHLVTRDAARNIAAEFAREFRPPEIPAWKDQAAFEEWAKSERYEMHQHPLHYLFLDPKTYAARMGWKAGLAFARAALSSPMEGGDA